VPPGVFHAQHQVAPTLVEVRRACLEDRLLGAPVEAAEVHEVPQEPAEVQVVPDELLDVADGLGLRAAGLVRRDELEEPCLQVAGEERVDPGRPERRDRAASRSGVERGGGGQDPLQLGPVRGSQAGARAEQRLDSRGPERGDAVCPGGVHGRERERGPGHHAGERLVGEGAAPAVDLDRAGLEVGAVEPREAPTVEPCEPAPREEVVDLCRVGCRGCEGGVRAVARWEQRRALGRGAGVPRGVLAAGDEEGVHLVCVHARLAAAVGLAAERRDDVRDHGLQRGVGRGASVHDPVAVERQLREHAGDVGDVVEDELAGVGLPTRGQHELRCREQRLAARRVVPDRGELERLRILHDLPRVAQRAEQEVDGAEDLGHAHAAVVVGVHEGHRPRVHRVAADRAGEGDPQRGVEVAERAQVLGGAEADLVDAACDEELPRMNGHVVETCE